MKVYMGKAPAVTADYIIDDIAFKLNVVAKTADYTVTVADSGTWFHNYGCTGTSEFTLPAVATGDGCIYWFFGSDDGAIKVTAPAAVLATHNSAGSTSVSWETGSEIIGGGFMVFGDGTLWYASPLVGAHTQTMTIA